jgi:hypothetical protein
MPGPYCLKGNRNFHDRFQIQWIKSTVCQGKASMNANDEDSGLTAEEIIRLCRSEIEAIHNLQYLLAADADNPHKVRGYAALLGQQLGTITELLCRRSVRDVETTSR